MRKHLYAIFVTQGEREAYKIYDFCGGGGVVDEKMFDKSQK